MLSPCTPIAIYISFPTKDGLVVYNNNLYAATDNEETGAEVWAYNGSTWTQVDNGWAGDANNIAAIEITVYNGRLYVGTGNRVTGAEIWRYTAPKISTWLPLLLLNN